MGQAGDFDGEWSDEPHKRLHEFYKGLLRMRKRLPPLTNSDMSFIEATSFDNEKAPLLRRWSNDEQLFACFNFGKNPAHVSLPLARDVWKKGPEFSPPSLGGTWIFTSVLFAKRRKSIRENRAVLVRTLPFR